MPMKCPKCGSKRIKRSQSRGFKERLQKLFNKKTYRCIDCGWRGIFKTKSSRTKRNAKKYILVKITIIIIIIIAVYLIISYLNREEPTPVQDIYSPIASISHKKYNKMDFIDLKTQQKRINEQLDANIQKVLAYGSYIMEQEVKYT